MLYWKLPVEIKIKIAIYTSHSLPCAYAVIVLIKNITKLISFMPTFLQTLKCLRDRRSVQYGGKIYVENYENVKSILPDQAKYLYELLNGVAFMVPLITLAFLTVNTSQKTHPDKTGRQSSHSIYHQSKDLFCRSYRTKLIRIGGNRHNIILKRFHSQIFHDYQSVMNVPEGVFRGSLDRFSGITVESQDEFDANIDFAEKLRKSLDYWIQSKRRAIWFKVNTPHAAWIPHLCENKFEFHHAKSGYAVLFRWLPTDEFVNIPPFAHTLLGVGGLVVNDKNEILVVSDRYALIPNSWKLPGGYVEARENLADAAIREVHEETGVECEFKGLISVRHSHKGGFGCSDMYFVLALRPLSEVLKPCQREIAKAKWMPISEYLQHPNVHETNRHFVKTFLNYKENGISFICEKAKHQILGIEYTLYYMQKQKETKQEEEDQFKCLSDDRA